MDTLRIIKHLWYGPRHMHRLFPKTALQHITEAIAASEVRHLGEIRFAVESSLPLTSLWRGDSARERAIEVFSDLRVWDTENNTGILIYLLLADHDVEIVADRGIHSKVGETGWQNLVAEMEKAFRAGQFESGVVAGVQALGDLLAVHFPATGDSADPNQDHNPNEQSDRPVLL
jgi:uncharacterized membrane protein